MDAAMRTLDVRWRAVATFDASWGGQRGPNGSGIGLANGVGRRVGLVEADDPRALAAELCAGGAGEGLERLEAERRLPRRSLDPPRAGDGAVDEEVAIDCGALFEKTSPRKRSGRTCVRRTCTRSTASQWPRKRTGAGASLPNQRCSREVDELFVVLVTECPQAHSLGDGEERRSSYAGPRGRIFRVDGPNAAR